jgi:hypothetical protein
MRLVLHYNTEFVKNFIRASKEPLFEFRKEIFSIDFAFIGLTSLSLSLVFTCHICIDIGIG